MTKEERKKAIDALKISAPIHALTEEEFNDYIQTLNKVMDWLEQEPKTGKWKRIGHDIYECSICGQDVMTSDICAYRHCHCCGTKMKVGVELEQEPILAKIRTEIEQLTITEGGEDYTRKMAELYSLKIKVLQIIDKYRGEQCQP